LGQVIGQGKLPRVSSFELFCCSSMRTQDLGAIVDGVQVHAGGLRRFVVLGSYGDAGWGYIAEALKAQGKGLSRLEELGVDTWGPHTACVLEALAAGAPCARTLKSLTLIGEFSTDSFAALFQALSNNAFPALTDVGAGRCLVSERPPFVERVGLGGPVP
jgi:hypothetical protein